MLDLLRGIAALLIVLRHIEAHTGISLERSYLAVDLFFVMSGVVVANAYEARMQSNTLGIEGFLRVRLTRLVPLYWLSIAIAAAVLWRHGMNAEAAAMLAVPALFLIPTGTPSTPNTVAMTLNGPAWSILAELVSNIAYALMLPRLTRFALGSCMILSGVLLAVIAIAGHRHNLDLGWRSTDVWAGFVRVGYSFPAGVLLYRSAPTLLGHMKVWNERTRSMAALLLMLMPLVLQPSPAWSAVWDLIAVIVLLPAATALAMSVECHGLVSYVSKTLGRLSYPLYILQASIIMAVQSTGDRLPLPGLWLVLLLVAAPFVLECWFDRPLRAWLEGLRSPTSDPITPSATAQIIPSHGFDISNTLPISPLSLQSREMACRRAVCRMNGD